MPDVSLININNTDINIKDATARKAVTDEVAARKAADAAYVGDNQTSTVTGDYTVTAGDIAETADNVTIHGKLSVLLDSDNEYNEDIAGTKTILTKKTIDNVQTDRVLTVGGNNSMTVTGVCTDLYNGNKTDTVEGIHTAIRNDVKIEISGETEITAANVKMALKGGNMTINSESFPVAFSDKTVDLHDIGNVADIQTQIDKLNATNGTIIDSYAQFANLAEKTTQGGILYSDEVGKGEKIGAAMPYIGVKGFYDMNGGFNEFDNRHANEFARIGAWKWKWNTSHKANTQPRIWTEIYLVDPDATLPSKVTLKIKHNGSLIFKDGSLAEKFLSHTQESFIHYEALIDGYPGEITPYDGAYSYDIATNTATLTFNPSILKTKVLHTWISDARSPFLGYDAMIGTMTMECDNPGVLGYHIGVDEYDSAFTAYEQCGTSTVIIGETPRSLTIYCGPFSNITQFANYRHGVNLVSTAVAYYGEGTNMAVNTTLSNNTISDLFVTDTSGTQYRHYILRCYAGAITAIKMGGHDTIPDITVNSSGLRLNSISVSSGYYVFNLQATILETT